MHRLARLNYIMKKKLLLMLAVALTLTACQKDMSKPNEVDNEYVLLKNGKEYQKDSVLTKLALYSKVRIDSIEYRPQDSTFFRLGWTFELDPIKYLDLK